MQVFKTCFERLHNVRLMCDAQQNFCGRVAPAINNIIAIEAHRHEKTRVRIGGQARPAIRLLHTEMRREKIGTRKRQARIGGHQPRGQRARIVENALRDRCPDVVDPASQTLRTRFRRRQQ